MVEISDRADTWQFPVLVTVMGLQGRRMRPPSRLKAVANLYAEPFYGRVKRRPRMGQAWHGALAGRP